MIDYILACFVIGLISGLTAASGPKHGSNDFAPLLILLLVWFYKAGMESSPLQATLGKLALGIKVASLTGERVSFWRATGRTFAQFLSAIIIYIGYLMAAFTKRRQALHDLIAGTLVVRKPYTSEEIANSPSASVGEDVVAAVIIVFGGIALIGILAAIAIPAYQDYTIRAQVTEGLNAATPYKAAVSDAAAQGMSVSGIRTEDLQVPDSIRSRYVASIKVLSGVIVITYGGAVQSPISGKDVVLIPGTSETGIVWACGHASLPAGSVPAIQKDLSSYTTVAEKYLPTGCKSGA